MGKSLEILKANVVLWLGLGFVLAWVFTALSFEGIVRSDPSLHFIGYIHDPLFISATATAACAFALTSALPMNALELLFNAWLKPASALTLLCGLAGIACATILFRDSQPMAVVAGVLVGLCLAYSFQCWANFFSEVDIGDVLLIVIVSFATSAVLSALCVSVSIANIVVASYLNMGYLAISFVLLVSYQGHFPLPPSSSEDRGSIARIAVFAAAVGFIAEFSWTFFLKGSVSYRESGFTEDYLFSAVLAVAVMVPFATSSRKVGYKLSRAYSMAILFIVVSLCLDLFSEHAVYWAYAVNQVVYYLSQIMVWLAALCLTFKLSDTSFRVCGAALGSMYFGLCMGFVSCSALQDRLYGNSDVSRIVIAALIVLIVAIALFVFRESDFVRLVNRPPKAASPNQDEKLLEIARRFKLSKRESEVFLYLAKGRNAVFIQEQLVLSYSTVSTHRQNIYGKLDVHTQQQLLDFVDEQLR